MLHQSLPFCPFSPPYCLPSSFSLFSSMSPPTSLLRSQVEMESFNEIFFSIDHHELDNRGNQFIEEFLVDELLDLRELPEPEKKVDEKEEETNEDSFISFEKNEALLLSEISLPEETEAAHLEWLSRFVHDCHSPQPPAAPASMAAALIPVKSMRSRRRRSAVVPWSLSIPPRLGDTFHVSSPSSSSSYQRQNQKTHIMHNHNTIYRGNFHTLNNYRKNYLKFKEGMGQPISLFCSATESYVTCEPYSVSAPKKRGRKPKNIFAGAGRGGERRCTHCGAQKTPQWRAGPGGPKTLCNACGVRFKSGRLLPEYRPACSPTFISKIHSNSHRKVLEMRRKKEEQLFTASAPVLHSS